MVEEFNDSVFLGKTGDKKVVHTVYGFHYIEILGQKGTEPAYKIAYLAKPVTVSQETDEAAQNEAQKFAGSVHTLKEFYDNAAKIKKLPFTAAGIKENDYSLNSNTPGMPNALGNKREFIKWVYNNDIGDISSAFAFNQKYLVGIITAVDKPGLPGAETTRPMVEPKVRNEKKAKIIIETKIKGNTLEAIAAANKAAVQQADSVAFQSPFIKSLGQEFKLLGASFNKQAQAKVSAPIAGEGGVFVIKGNGIAGVAPKGTAESQRTTEQLTLKAQQQSYLQALLKAANIKDYRSKFF
jgi:peptidyl-prolyl cis-trans isomerase D